MTVSEDVIAGIVCMTCLQMLIADDGETICDLDAPCLCEECWKDQGKPNCPYFCEESGTVCCE